MSIKLRTTAVFGSIALCCASAFADPGYYVVTAYDDPGLRSIDFRYWTVRRPGRPEMVWPEAGFAWNPVGRWHSELLASWIGSSQDATRLSTLNWQNDWLLTRGQYPVDVALHSLLGYGQNPAGGTLFELGPVLQTDFGRTQVNANLFLERGYGAFGGEPTQLKYQWQIRHRWRHGLHFGAQGFGELGPWDRWSPHDAQSHRAGPALFGRIPLGGNPASGGGDGARTPAIAWQAAWLVGSTYRRHGQMLTLQVRFDF